MVKIHHYVHAYHHGQQEQQQKKTPTTNKINKQQTASSNLLFKWMLLTIPTSLSSKRLQRYPQFIQILQQDRVARVELLTRNHTSKQHHETTEPEILPMLPPFLLGL